MAPTTVPIMIVFNNPDLVIMRPDAAPNTNIIRANGSCNFAHLMGSPPKPTGWGF